MMLTGIKGFLRDRRDTQEMLNMRATMVSIQQLLFPENETTGVLVRMKTGLALTQRLEERLGLNGPSPRIPVDTDYELDREGKFFDTLPPDKLGQLSNELARLAGRTELERGNPEEWSEDSGEATANVAHAIALRLLSGWLRCKFIVHTSMNRKVIREAQEHEELYYMHIKRLLRLLRGETAVQEEEPETAPDDDNLVLDVLHAIRALQVRGASDEEWEIVLKQQQARLRSAIERRTDPDHGIKDEDRKFVTLEEVISGALEEGKRPNL